MNILRHVNKNMTINWRRKTNGRRGRRGRFRRIRRGEEETEDTMGIRREESIAKGCREG